MIEITKEESEFEKFIKEGVSLVYFGATWCGPCKMLKPVIEDIEKSCGDKYKIAHVDIDVHKDITEEHSVQSVPTIIVFEDGKYKSRIVGYHSRKDIEQMVEESLA